ncbi:hypothetical protein V6N13_051831 [Hibiscus sabdariffa]
MGKIRDSERFKQRQPEKLGSEPQKDKMNQVYGVIDPVKYDTLKNCVVGWCKRFIRAGRLAKELHDAGVRGVTIMSISGSKFLMIFKDSVQKQSFMEEHGGALEEWFKEIKDWSVDMEVVNRRAWIACHGIPIHAWSTGTFENIASKWGELISVDEKTVNPGSFSKAMFQVLTERFNRIDEVIELVVDSKKFKVRAVEVEPTFSPNSLWLDEETSSSNCDSSEACSSEKIINGQRDVAIEMPEKGREEERSVGENILEKREEKQEDRQGDDNSGGCFGGLSRRWGQFVYRAKVCETYGVFDKKFKLPKHQLNGFEDLRNIENSFKVASCLKSLKILELNEFDCVICMVLVEEKSFARILTLNRPKQLNALSFQMTSRLLELFLAYEEDPNVKLVILKGKGRAFCAGGDVADVVHAIRAGGWKARLNYFMKGYTLNYLMATYSKPQVSILNGIVMGGGNGISLHGRFRVVTEKTIWDSSQMKEPPISYQDSQDFLNKCDARAKFKGHMSKSIVTTVGLMHSSVTFFHASSNRYSKSLSGSICSHSKACIPATSPTLIKAIVNNTSKMDDFNATHIYSSNVGTEPSCLVDVRKRMRASYAKGTLKNLPSYLASSAITSKTTSTALQITLVIEFLQTQIEAALPTSRLKMYRNYGCSNPPK